MSPGHPSPPTFVPSSLGRGGGAGVGAVEGKGVGIPPRKRYSNSSGHWYTPSIGVGHGTPGVGQPGSEGSVSSMGVGE